MNNLKLIFTTILTLLSLTGFTQQTAFFETTLYFEDAVGNRDTIVVGHDPEANDSFNPAFGEVDINMPWDSVFEVRASHIEDAFYYDSPIPTEDIFSKKIIGSAQGGIDTNSNCLPFKRGIILHVSHKYLPIRISWNKAAFDNVCSSNSFIASHQNPLTSFEWWTYPLALERSACMVDTNQFIISAFDDLVIDFYAMDQIEGIGLGRVDGVLVSFGNQASFDSSCGRDVVSVDLLIESIRFSLFPNPTTGLINLESEKAITWQLFDTRGNLLNEGADQQVNLANYPNGVYFLSAVPLEGGSPKVEKVVKMN